MLLLFPVFFGGVIPELIMSCPFVYRDEYSKFRLWTDYSQFILTCVGLCFKSVKYFNHGNVFD